MVSVLGLMMTPNPRNMDHVIAVGAGCLTTCHWLGWRATERNMTPESFLRNDHIGVERQNLRFGGNAEEK